MSTFSPPVDASGIPPVLPFNEPEQTIAGWKLMRHYQSRPLGVNVYVYKAGSPSALAYGQVSNIDPVATYDNTGVATSTGWSDVQQVFWGSYQTPYPVDATTAALLVAAGYTVDP